MKNERKNFIERVMSAKMDAEHGLQGIGKRMRKNVEQGQKDLREGKMKHYGTINPFK